MSKGINSPSHSNDYYPFTVAEKLDGRYLTFAAIGKGSYGIVLRAYDLVEHCDVAIKIFRQRDKYQLQGHNEINILLTMKRFTTNFKYPIINIKHHFFFKGFLCAVFPLYQQSIFQAMRVHKFMGFGLHTVKRITQQLLEALLFLQHPSISVIHCDLKPENILIVNSRSYAIKLIDFGSSMHNNVEQSFYIQSRFYRAPEVLMEIKYSYPIDMWSMGCIMMELHTGRPLFSAKNEVELLHKIIEICGIPPIEMIKASPKWTKFLTLKYGTYYPSSHNSEPFSAFTIAPASRTLKDTLKSVYNQRVGTQHHSDEDYYLFLNLVEKMLSLDPAKRITPLEALRHPFIGSSMEYKVGENVHYFSTPVLFTTPSPNIRSVASEESFPHSNGATNMSVTLARQASKNNFIPKSSETQLGTAFQGISSCEPSYKSSCCHHTNNIMLTNHSPVLEDEVTIPVTELLTEPR